LAVNVATPTHQLVTGALVLKTVRETLPNELKSVFDQLVEDYRFLALKHHGSPFASYVVLAELVKIGWRPPKSTKDHQ
jgi:hypothetical protein